MGSEADPHALLSISEVAAASGVTTRTLRYYQEIGLLHPSRTRADGQRRYGPDELRRLQRILLLRELGVPLSAIARVLADESDEVTVLGAHRDSVRNERDRLSRLMATINRTIDHLEEGAPMRPDELFDGFDAEKQAQYEAELVERYGPQAQEAIDESWRRVARMSKSDAASINPAFKALETALASFLVAGAEPADPAVQEVVAAHHAVIMKFWTPDRESYIGLGQMYVDHPEFRSRKDAVHPGLAEFERDAMTVYAEATLN